MTPGGKPARASIRRQLGRVGLLTTLLIALLSAACGAPMTDQAQPLATQLIPASPSASPTETEPALATPTPALYFTVGADRVQAVRRQGETGAPQAEAAELLNALVAGPNEAELAAGLSSALIPGLTLNLTGLSDGHATVDVVGDAPGPAATQAQLAVAQIVLTITGITGIDTVTLTRNGHPIEAALPDGSLTALPLTHADYAALLRS